MIIQHSARLTTDCRRYKRQKGFTLLEILIVMGIISVLALIATPLYQGYTLRARIGSDLGQMVALKLVVTEHFNISGEWPTSNADAQGAKPAESYAGRFVERIDVTDSPKPGSLKLTYDTSILPALSSGNQLVFYPEYGVDGGVIQWKCDTSMFVAHLAPTQCRG